MTSILLHDLTYTDTIPRLDSALIRLARRHLVLLLALVLALLVSNRAQAAAWPPTTTNSYTVAPSEAVMTIPTMVLPAGFVLTFDPSIQTVQWRVGSLLFGQGAVIDLSHANPAPPAPAAQPVKAASPGYGQPGPGGDPGTPGTGAVPGITFSMTITTLASPNTGSLWIRTTGAPGGVGGAGGQGAAGGGGNCNGIFGHPTPAGGGGPGGPGGPGGLGGAVGSIVLQNMTLAPGFQELPTACSATCGQTSVPPGSLRNDGTMVIWGAPGCGGGGGPGGAGGNGGDEFREPRHCTTGPFTTEFIRGGPHGTQGPPGPTGPPGGCGIASVVGPAVVAQAPAAASGSNRDQCIANLAAACDAYKLELTGQCPSQPTPAARAFCFSRAQCWSNRGIVVSQLSQACASDPPSPTCLFLRNQLTGRLSAASCDAPPGAGPF